MRTLFTKSSQLTVVDYRKKKKITSSSRFYVGRCRVRSPAPAATDATQRLHLPVSTITRSVSLAIPVCAYSHPVSPASRDEGHSVSPTSREEFFLLSSANRDVNHSVSSANQDDRHSFSITGR